MVTHLEELKQMISRFQSFTRFFPVRETASYLIMLKEKTVSIDERDN
jgi:hypothetical protein